MLISKPNKDKTREKNGPVSLDECRRKNFQQNIDQPNLRKFQKKFITIQWASFQGCKDSST